MNEYNVKDVIGDEQAMFDLFERIDFREQADKLEPENMYTLVYYWYSTPLGMEYEDLYCPANLDDVDLFGLVWDREKEECKVLSEDNKKLVLDIMAERLRCIKIHVELEDKE